MFQRRTFMNGTSMRSTHVLLQAKFDHNCTRDVNTTDAIKFAGHGSDDGD